MGSVTQATVTGDNDPDIYPRKYTRRYFYCNQCGSFKLKFISTIKQDPPPPVDSRSFTFFSFSFFFSLLACLAWVFFDLIMDMAAWGYYIPIWFVVSLIGLMRTGPNIKSSQTRKRDGLQCMDCQQQYLFGSPFFTKKTNPRKYTEDDIPPCGESPYWEEN